MHNSKMLNPQMEQHCLVFSPWEREGHLHLLVTPITTSTGETSRRRREVHSV